MALHETISRHDNHHLRVHEPRPARMIRSIQEALQKVPRRVVGLSRRKTRRQHGVGLHVGQRVLPQAKVAPVLREGRQVRRVGGEGLGAAQRVVSVGLAVEVGTHEPGSQRRINAPRGSNTEVLVGVIAMAPRVSSSSPYIFFRFEQAGNVYNQQARSISRGGGGRGGLHVHREPWEKAKATVTAGERVLCGACRTVSGRIAVNMGSHLLTGCRNTVNHLQLDMPYGRIPKQNKET